MNWISKENKLLTLKRVSRRRAITNDYNIVDMCIVTITDVYKNVNNAFDNCIQNSYVCICSWQRPIKCPAMKLLLILLRTSSICLDPIYPCATLHTVLCINILVVLSAVQHIHSVCQGFLIFDNNCNCHHPVGLKLPALQTFPCVIIANVSLCFLKLSKLKCDIYTVTTLVNMVT